MSFADNPSALESQPTTWRRTDDPQYADDPEFQQYTTQLSDQLFALTANISKLSNQIGLLGTKRETDRVRERVQDLLSETGDSFKDVGEGLRKVAAWHDLGPSQKYTQGKLNQEFKASLTEFQGLQRQALEKQRASATAAKAALDQDGDSLTATTDAGQQQLQQQEAPRLANQDEVEYQETLIQTRETEIQQIENSVSELNELFRDVAHMVHDQGGQLDVISENVVQTRDDTREADSQLRTASRHQRSARGKACCLLVVLVVVLTVIILAAVLGSVTRRPIMSEPEARETNPLITLANSTTNLTYASTKPYLTSQLRQALRTLARGIMQTLVDQGRAFLFHDPNALPGLPKDVLWVLGPDPEANDLTHQWSEFAFVVETTSGFDRPAGACEGMSDNVARILLVSAWEQRRMVRRSFDWRRARIEMATMLEGYQE
ncbi:SNAP receptor [Friedmanniomyces endolithicus]|nr:SNAP receptor [Friedmanniomyces endolithicus]